MGEVYAQLVVDTFCSLAFYEALDMPIGANLTDNGREFCVNHPFERLLAVEGVEYRTTRIASSRTTGFVKRMNLTLLDECFRVAGRQTWYIGTDEIQRDLDRFLRYSTSNAVNKASA